MRPNAVAKIGHRGAGGHAPENTLAAIEKGIALGADFVELDIQRTHDGELVCMHDKFVDRTTDGTGAVAELRLHELKKLNAGHGERVPTLSQALQAANGRVGVILESIAARTGPEILRAVRSFQFQSPVIFSSFLHRELLAIRQFEPSAKTMALLEGIPVAMTTFAVEAKATHVGLSIDSTSGEFVDALHQAGLLVFIYTVNEPRFIEMATRFGADGLISDYPDRIRDTQ